MCYYKHSYKQGTMLSCIDNIFWSIVMEKIKNFAVELFVYFL